MNPTPEPTVRLSLTADDAFSYGCRRCGRCCRGKRIQVNPYEVARLARRLGLSGAEVRARFTIDGQGAALKQTEAGACIFLPDGCGVHPDRPLGRGPRFVRSDKRRRISA